MNILFMTSPVPERTAMFVGEKKPPIGVGLLMAIVKQHGHTVYFSDEYLSRSNLLDTDFLERKKIDLVGIYANTICYEGTLDLLESLRRKRESGSWKGLIAMGGPHTSIGLDTIPDLVDYVVQGEGEVAMMQIIDGTAEGRVIQGVKFENMDDLPFPAWEEMIHKPYPFADHFIDETPAYNMNTSRGCPFDCAFCSVNACWGRSYRAMSPERVVDEMLYLKKYYGARAIYFREDHFTFHPKRTQRFCELMGSRQVGLPWLAESRIDSLVNENYCRMLKEGGCHLLYLGIESGSQRMLDFYRKRITVEDVIERVGWLKKAGVKTYASFIEGTPGETDEDRAATRKLIETINPDFVGINPYVGLPGSDIYKDIKEKGIYMHEDPTHVLFVEGHDARVDKYWGGQERYKTPKPSNGPLAGK